ncbi:gamma-butyrobetaine hydroxylase [Marinomonas ushuaiensis DSM 15871]|uniref:Gamma-butyrobetaine hydroxylase n=1 Tax=Marinomonas ushuaiensis DSM 15871 TaxID=1122207 RepID=X7EBE0_9GAMM|nr:TauD/TfdA family dioxygenase [Marinomonas ushuaiensis]ETX12531.1 gamma-butyrobetaine hydroxylase [Marinomonas ushuaiensis DSM 15871]
MKKVTFSINEESNTLFAQFDGKDIELAALWLRERCQDEQHLDKISKQRFFDPHQLPNDLSITKIEPIASQEKLTISFSDGYTGTYDLIEFHADFDVWDGTPVSKPWLSNIDKANFSVDFDNLKSDQGLLNALEIFLAYGLIIVNGVPERSNAVIEVAELFGNIRQTNFGKHFEVYTRPNSNDLAYRSVSLGAHTDNPYRDPMPGVQLLHCIKNETTGGLSTLVDSLSVIEQLRKEDPYGVELLSTVPVRYRHFDQDIDLIERRTMVKLDSAKRVEGVAYSPRLDFLPLLEPEQLKTFHRARQRLGQLFSDPRFEWRFKLEPGQLQMFHNTRVLHGRTSFDPNEGYRHLQGAYIDLDEPKGRYVALKRKVSV